MNAFILNKQGKGYTEKSILKLRESIAEILGYTPDELNIHCGEIYNHPKTLQNFLKDHPEDIVLVWENPNLYCLYQKNLPILIADLEEYAETDKTSWEIAIKRIKVSITRRNKLKTLQNSEIIRKELSE